MTNRHPLPRTRDEQAQPTAKRVAAAEVIDSAEAGAAPSSAPPGATAAETAAEEAQAPSAQPSAQRRDFLPGVWVQRYPDSSVALVILRDGRYLRSSSAAAGAPVQDGRWTREGTNIIFTPADQPALAAAPPAPARTGAPGTPAPPAAVTATPSGPWRMSIVSSTSRMLALRSESGAIAIFGRP